MAITQVEPYIVDATATYTLGNVVVTGTTNLGAVSNITITGGTNGQFLTSNGAGGVSFSPAAATAKAIALAIAYGG